MKIFKESIFVLTLMVLALSMGSLPAAAQSLFPLPDASVYGNVPAPAAGGTAEQQFAQLVWGTVLNVRYIIGAVAVAMIVYSGFRMVTGWGKEDVYSQQRNSILYAVIGLAIVAMASEFANVFQVDCPQTLPGQTAIPCTEGGFLANSNALIRTALLFDQRTQIVITFVKYIVGAIAVLVIIRSGFRMITMTGAEDKIALDKKNLAYGAFGLFLIIIADTVISQVLYKVDQNKYPGVQGAQPAFSAERGVEEIIGFTNFVVSIVGPIGVLALLAGGVMYIAAGGQEDKMERAKRLVFAAITGLVVIYGAFAIVSTFIVGNFEG